MATQTYSQAIQMPKTKREGLENFLQMVINKLEADDTREALLTAVDLLEDVRCGVYDDAMTDAAGANRLAKEMNSKFTQEVIRASEAGYARGVADEKARMAVKLGLVVTP